MNITFTGFISLLLATVVYLSNAQAATITGVDGIFGTGLGEVNGLGLGTNAPNNDNAPNAAGVNFFFYDEIIFDQVGEIDIVVNLADSGGVTEYSMFVSTFNFTPTTWVGFEIELGFGSGSSFQSAMLGTGLDFDTPDWDPLPSSNEFSSVTLSDNYLLFDNGDMPFGFVDAVFWAVDVPDGYAQMTMRLAPVVSAVPVPAAVWLFGTGILGLIGFSKHRKSA